MEPIPYYVPVFGGPADGDEVVALPVEASRFIEGVSYTLILALRPGPQPGQIIERYEYHPTPIRAQ